jgi:hypothetical protein
MNHKGIKTLGAESSAGLSLLEVLACAAILGVVINLCASVFVTSSRLSVLGTTALDRIHVVQEIRDGFISTVRESCAVVPTLSEYSSGSEQIILEMAQRPAQKAGKRYAILGRFGSESRLGRLKILEKDGKYSAEGFVTYPLEFDSIRFGYDKSTVHEARLISLEFDIKNTGNRRGRRAAHKFTAAIRGVSAAR